MTRPHPSTIRRAAALAACGVLLFVAGCGDDDEPADTTAGTPLSKSDFIAQADAICAEGNAEIEAAATEQFGNEQPSGEEATAFVEETVIPVLEQEANEIDELGPPNGDVDDVENLVDELRSAIEAVEAEPESILDGSAEADFEEANRLASEFGLQECGESG